MTPVVVKPTGRGPCLGERPLTGGDVLRIRKLRAAGHTQRELARMFGCSPGTVHRVVSTTGPRPPAMGR
jgi:hypothetical protein